MSRKTRRDAQARQQGGKKPVKITKRPSKKAIPQYKATK